MIDITSYSKKKENSSTNTSNSSSGGSSPTIIQNGSGEVSPVTIWGQTHDHTQSVINGELTTPSNINSTAAILCHATAQSGDDIDNGTVDADLLRGNIESNVGSISSLTSNEITTENITVNENLVGKNATLQSTKTDYLNAYEAVIHNLEVTGKAHFFELVIDKIKAAGGAVIFSPADGFNTAFIQYSYRYWVNNGTSSVKFTYDLPIGYYPVFPIDDSAMPAALLERIETGEIMYVRRQDTNALYAILNNFNYAFTPYKLAIRQLSPTPSYESLFETSRSGRTPSKLGGVEATIYPWITLYWKAEEDNKKIYNGWVVNDQLVCQNFNKATTGTSQNVSNKYFWGVVQEVSDEAVDAAIQYVLAQEVKNLNDPIKCHYIRFISDTSSEYEGGQKIYATGFVDPEPGDSIVMLGHRDDDCEDCEARQSAIYITCYKSIDSTLNPPFFAQYKGINDFTIEGKAESYFSRDKNLLTGDTIMVAGKDVNDELMTNDMSIRAIELTNVDKIINYDYAQWMALKGKVMTVNCSGITNMSTFLSKYQAGVYVLVEEPIFGSSEKVTLYGQITKVENTVGKPSITNKSVSINVLLVLSGSISEIQNKYSLIRQTQDSIKLEVADIENGVSQLEIRADGIESNVTDLEGNLSSLSQNYAGFRTHVNSKFSNVESEITQTADEINLRVDDVELKINNNEIVLDGNTKIEGDLVLNAEDQGLTIVGPNGEILELKPKNLDTYSNFTANAIDTRNFSGSTSPYYAYSKATQSSVTIDSVSYTRLTWDFDNTIKVSLGELGNYNVNLINFQTYIQAYSYQLNGGNYPVFSQTGCGGSITNISVKIYRNGSTNVIKTISVSASNSDIVSVSNFLSEYNFYTTDDYYMNVNIKGQVWVSYNSSTNTWANGNGITIKMSSNVQRQKANDAYSLITYNGIGINFGNYRTIYFGSEGFKVRYGDYGIGIMPNSSTPFMKWNGTSWVAWTKLKELYDS